MKKLMRRLCLALLAAVIATAAAQTAEPKKILKVAFRVAETGFDPANKSPSWGVIESSAGFIGLA